MKSKNTLHRIKEYIDSKNISVYAFEQSVGMSNGSFASQLKNNKTIGVDKLENILNIYTDISIEWLLTGRGEMLRVETEKSHTLDDSSIDDHAVLIRSIDQVASMANQNSTAMVKMAETASQNSIAIAKMVETASQNSMAIVKMAETADRHSIALEKIIDLLTELSPSATSHSFSKRPQKTTETYDIAHTVRNVGA